MKKEDIRIYHLKAAQDYMKEAMKYADKAVREIRKEIKKEGKLNNRRG